MIDHDDDGWRDEVDDEDDEEESEEEIARYENWMIDRQEK